MRGSDGLAELHLAPVGSCDADSGVTRGSPQGNVGGLPLAGNIMGEEGGGG